MNKPKKTYSQMIVKVLDNVLGPNPKHQTAADLISKKVLKIVRDHSRHRVNVMLAALMEDFTAAIEKRKYPNA